MASLTPPPAKAVPFNDGRGCKEWLNALPLTNIPQAQNSLKFSNLFFPLGLDIARAPLDQPYIGEHARRIFPVGKKYTDKPSPRQVPPGLRLAPPDGGW